LGQKGLSDPHQRDVCISHAESKEEWINLGARIHGAFGPFVAVGIRIGLDAVDELEPGLAALPSLHQDQAALFVCGRWRHDRHACDTSNCRRLE
jgi:hypothetical protein